MGTIGASGPTAFTGNSSFSAQLQQVIANAVSMASTPLQQLQAQQGTLTGQQTELQTLGSEFQRLQAALDGINTGTGLASYSAVVSDTSIATTSVSSGVMAGSYDLTVSNIGTQTNTVSKDGLTTVTDPSSQNIDTSSSYTLTIDGHTFSITDATGNLSGLAQAINQSGANVQATVVNVGSSASPDYRLSVQSTKYAPDSIQLNDGSADLLNVLTTGSYVSYQVNGEPSVPINSDSRTISVSPGLSVNLLKTGSATMTVSQNVSSLSDSLSSFASAYNGILAELQKNRGQGGGALSGQSIVYELQQELSNLATYSAGSNGIASLSDLGLTFDQSGNLQFDSSTFDTAAATSPSAVLNFLGSETGGGFLQAANTILASSNATTTGLIPQATQVLSSELNDVGNKITAQETQITQLQDSLTTQMAAADAAISSLEQQVTEMTDLFTTMQQDARANNGG